LPPFIVICEIPPKYLLTLHVYFDVRYKEQAEILNTVGYQQNVDHDYLPSWTYLFSRFDVYNERELEDEA
jgi:hypothetical protein